MLQRRFSSFRNVLQSLDPSKPVFVEKCPQPTYDTGCTYCEPQYPILKPIDYKRQLRSSKATVWKHLLILDETHPDQWTKKLELLPGSLNAEIARLKRKIMSPYHPILVSNVHFPNYKNSDGTIKLILYPDNQVIEVPNELQGDEQYVSDLIANFLTPQEQELESKKQFKVSSHQKQLVLVCGHTQRDARCGIVAPMLIEEFNKVLSDKSLEDNVDVGTVSHVGGHAFAGNVLYFNKQGESIWYGRVKPLHVQGIIEETIINGKVIEELFRG